MYFSLCSLSFVLSLDITEKSVDPSSSQYPIRYLYTLTGSFLSPEPFLTQSRQSQLSQPLLVRGILQVFQSALWPFTGLTAICSCLSCNGDFRTAHSTPNVVSPMLNKGERPVISSQPADLFIVHFVPGFRSLLKILNSIGPSIDPWYHHYRLASSWTSCH